MKLIDRAQAPIFDDVNDFNQPIVTHIFGVIRVGDKVKEYLYDVGCGRDLFADMGGSFPLLMKRFDRDGKLSSSDFDLRKYCEGMAEVYSKEVENLRVGLSV